MTTDRNGLAFKKIERGKEGKRERGRNRGRERYNNIGREKRRKEVEVVQMYVVYIYIE